MNIDHHTEQMEAIRAEFHRPWLDHLLPAIAQLNPPIQAMPAIEHIAWKAFVIGRLKREET